MAKTDRNANPFIKVVYFDEQTASDYLDISAGGSVLSVEEKQRQRAVATHAEVQTKVAARLSWLPFLSGSASIEAGVDASTVGQSFLSKTLSNTILTDYLGNSADDRRIHKLRGYALTAEPGSFAHAKMFTPFMLIANTADQGVDLAKLDEALEQAKGYYELTAAGSANEPARVLRFNIRAFRNNYRLADLLKMKLVFHGIHVGSVREDRLDMQAEMGSPEATTAPSGVELAELATRGTTSETKTEVLDVYDIVLAGIEG